MTDQNPNTDSDADPDSEATDGDDTTTSTQTRWAYTNDILAGVLVATLCAAVGAQLLSNATTSKWVWTPFATAALLATIWAFGDRAVTALSNLRG